MISIGAGNSSSLMGSVADVRFECRAFKRRLLRDHVHRISLPMDSLFEPFGVDN